MKPDYRETGWYEQVPEQERPLLDRLVAAQRAQGNMDDLAPMQLEPDFARLDQADYAAGGSLRGVRRNAREAPIYSKHKSLSPRNAEDGHATERPPASHVGVLKVPESLKAVHADNFVERLAQSPVKKGAGKYWCIEMTRLSSELPDRRDLLQRAQVHQECRQGQFPECQVAYIPTRPIPPSQVKHRGRKARLQQAGGAATAGRGGPSH